MLLVTWRCCSPAWPLLKEKRTGKKKNRSSKKVELHGPMVAQRCLGVKTNSPRKFALVSCFELLKQTQNELRFGLILFEMTSYQFVLRFCLKYIGAFILISRYDKKKRDLRLIINEKVSFYYCLDKMLHISLWNGNMSNNKTKLKF